MPAAAVIPAPIAYIKVVAIKKPVVEFEVKSLGLSKDMYLNFLPSLIVNFRLETI